MARLSEREAVRFAGGSIRLVLIAGLLGYAVCVTAIMIKGTFFPYELEWCEASVLNGVARVFEGQAFYCAPTLQYVPIAYNPAYFHVSCAVARLTGLSLLPLRLVSLVSFGAVIALFVVRMYRGERSVTGAAVAAGLCFVFFKHSEGWYHLARIDSLFVALLAAAALMLERPHDRLRVMLGACLLYGAFMVKQTGLLYAPVFGLWLLVRDRGSAIRFAVLFAVLTIGTVAVLDLATDGWYSLYALKFQGERAWNLTKITGWLKLNTSVVVLAALVPAILAAAMWRRRVEPAWWPFAYFAGLVGASVVINFAALSQAGAYVNNMMPSFLFLALLIGWIVARVESSKGHVGLVCLVLIAFMYKARFDVDDYWVGADDVQKGRAVEALLRRIDGPVWVTCLDSFYHRGGRRPLANYMLIYDLRRSSLTAARDQFVEEVNRAVESRRFAAVLTYSRIDRFFRDRLHEAGYEALPIETAGIAAFPMKVGMELALDRIYVRDAAVLRNDTPRPEKHGTQDG